MHSQGFVSVHALSAGYLTLPERFFVTPLDDPLARRTVPSLSFLVQHKDSETQNTTRMVFDLGIRRKLDDYPKPIYKHAMTRQPLSGEPDTLASLASGGLTPDHIDMVVFSHLHWDHVGTPSDYPHSTYVVGPGAVDLIGTGRVSGLGSHNHFEMGMLDLKRTIELRSTSLPSTPPPEEDGIYLEPQTQQLVGHFTKPWQQKGHFEAVMDVFNDGSVYIVSAPGHLDGHINLLCRLEDGSHVYLAGDACHDERILTGEKDIATWVDQEYAGAICCIHKDKAVAEKTIAAIRDTVEDPGDLRSVEVIFAHDAGWAKQAEKQGRFFPGSL
ncbi:beta-lactamase-like protein [Dactylonectria macrodidyma]|uniref:Beta-lactamase-like protein n=1 Tax=Dactylonectria macrodidyma TaxID=307937 RepID=A0A9P9DGM7_9HYPO|nr:beta-lactamase-like protein [Dactylonectria macrodidyma]